MMSITTLQRAVEERHGCFALLREIVGVSAYRSDGSSWEGPVVVFSLAGHPTAEVAYAWCDPGQDPSHLEIHIAVQGGHVTSPQTAVRARLRKAQLRGVRVS